jgi:hypothetical protein
MGEQVMSDPLPENIEGQKVVTHRFDHGIDWSVNVSHLLLAVAVLAVAWIVYRQRASDDREGPLDG